VISGDDFLTYPMMACGAKGVISVSANVIPDRVKAMVKATIDGDFSTARKLHLALLEFHTAMFMDSNPVPVKTSLALMGMIEDKVRLPLVGMSAEKLENLKNILKSYKIL